MKSAPLCVTMGEPAGIGGEITLKAWQALRGPGPAFFVLDSPQRLSRIASSLGLDVPVRAIADPSKAGKAFGDALPVLPLGGEPWAEPGQPQDENSASVIAAIENAVGLARAGVAGAVVTNPINKAVLQASGFAHPGHTEFLAALSGAPLPVMMLASEELRVVPVTIHVPLRSVPQLLTPELIVDSALVVEDSMRRLYRLPSPRLVISGLNPHAGEDGTMGDEEIHVIRPAVEALRAKGIDIRGPLAADTLFTEAARATYDVALCTYHDQALIPIKTLAMDQAVNVTLGLPVIRTSPDHGTAFDIAGRGVARPDSLIAAIRLAGRFAEGG